MNDSFQSAYQEEAERLHETMTEIHRQYDRLHSVPVYTGTDFTEQVLEDTREMRRQRLQRAMKEPYFGRLDFEELGKLPLPLYIGKHGVDRDIKPGQAESYPYVVDWRAPVASLFYSFTGGTDLISYEAPEGAIEGYVHLKRNLVIREQSLQRVVDTFNREEGEGDGPVTDEFLVYRLGENKDNRLRDIVSTIQVEQDRIIRAPKNKALFIQGVAGSGKTTVALHRLAFLLYQYHEQIRADKMMIFAPNRMFLDYISNVLPELGVGNIQQRTFPEWTLEVIGLEGKVELASSMEQAEKWFGSIAGRPVLDDQVSGRFKGSIAFMRMIEARLSAWEQQAVPVENFIPWDGGVLSNRIISDWFYNEYRSYEPAKRKERVFSRIQRWIEMELKHERSKTLLKEKKKSASQRLKSYMKKWADLDTFSMYRSLFDPKQPLNVSLESMEDAEHLTHSEHSAHSDRVDDLPVIPPDVQKETFAYLRKKTVRHEDLAAMLYLHVRLNGVASEYRYDHVVIDEAQDFSPLQVAVLDYFVRNHSFTVLGDLSQGIHAYAGILDWSEMRSLFKTDENDYFALTRSYRSTMEIIHFANVILERGVKTDMLAVPVFRSGQRVRLIELQADPVSRLIQAIQHMKASGYNTVALLTRTADEARALASNLQAAGAAVNLIDGNQQQYAGGVSVLPVYLSKGLEFDAVLLMDADAEHYPCDPLDAKLMYVGCTRALHELWVLRQADAELSPLIETNDEEIIMLGWPDNMDNNH
ncbi:HelD family protein [Paenibacillus sp. 481]|uniref:HelD family protein n=1 Tax=Paenibacillus sp. 481 TaxID=2835869 RepID=UPI001E37D399|nr:UvrD-helicase domain-containing protein [Paenibacillus sp. 481]UHA72797.1 AAA family ATPase [Paenibacillus sp. 481]